MTAGTIELARIKSVIRSVTGVVIDAKNEYLIASRLGPLLEEFGLASFDQFADRLEARNDEQMQRKFLERITTHETRFFRDESTFAALSEQMIPEWMERTRSKQLRIWSAASSTGQEPYSIAMLIHHRFPQIFQDLYILATDISDACSERAQTGVFTEYEINRGLPEDFLKRYFTATQDGYQISAEIRSKVQFLPHNLLSLPYSGTFDLVFCRNVLIYFDLDVRKKILEGLQSVLTSDGFLILGAAETPTGLLESYVIRQFGLTRYYELNSSNFTLAPRFGG